MSKHFIVADKTERGIPSFSYPADKQSVRLIEHAGGRSRLTTEQLLFLNIKTVGPGDDCSDMPKAVLEIYISRGWVKEVNESVTQEK